jgi:hypothetical protein
MAAPAVLAATVSAADADGTPQLLTELQLALATAMTEPGVAVSIGSAANLPTGWIFGAQAGGSIGVQGNLIT